MIMITVFTLLCHNLIILCHSQVVVVGNPANTNAYICKKYAPSIPPQNFTALTRLDQNRAQAQVSPKPRSQVTLYDIDWI